MRYVYIFLSSSLYIHIFRFARESADVITSMTIIPTTSHKSETGKRSHGRHVYINSYSAHFVLLSLFNYTLNWSRNYTTLKVININQTLAIRLNNLLFDKERFQMA